MLICIFMIFFYAISANFLKIKDHENKMIDRKVFQPIIVTPQKKLPTSIKWNSRNSFM